MLYLVYGQPQPINRGSRYGTHIHGIKNFIELLNAVNELEKLRHDYMSELAREQFSKNAHVQAEVELHNHRRGEIRKMMDNRVALLNSAGFVVKFETCVIEGYETIQRITITE